MRSGAKNVTLEEAWAVLRSENFNHQYEDSWLSIHPDKVLVGRALTAEWMPGRPDIQRVIEANGKKENRQGAENAWPVDMLRPRDVYVCDHFELPGFERPDDLEESDLGYRKPRAYHRRNASSE